MVQFKESLYRLIVATATNMPEDVRRVIAKAVAEEKSGTQAAQALAIIARNIDMACESEQPICQDTGMPTFVVRCPVGLNQIEFRRDIERAIIEATANGKLRPNSVDPLTGKSAPDNIGPGTPIVHFEQWEENDIEVKLILKGGGCENKNIQYSLPSDLPGVGRANRDLDGVYRCLMHAVHQAQGQGCSAGILGVCIGGDRTSSYDHAKAQLFRSLDDVNPHPDLAKLEERIVKDANQLGIGTMGFGGAITLLGCKIGALNRLPASFFVSVAYECWAYRRLGMRIDPATGVIKSWQFLAESPVKMARAEGIPATGREVDLATPITAEAIQSLKVGDVVMLSGQAYTARDAVHKYLVDHEAPVDLRGGVIYHCGPVVMKKEGGWKVVAAGPTTSIREEPYQAKIIHRFGVRMVIGKGGMGAKTLAALQENGAVYLTAIGGAAQYYADRITSVGGVDYLEEFGPSEAMWHLRVERFPAVVTMDAHGNSLHQDIEDESLENLELVAHRA